MSTSTATAVPPSSMVKPVEPPGSQKRSHHKKEAAPRVERNMQISKDISKAKVLYMTVRPSPPEKTPFQKWHLVSLTGLINEAIKRIALSRPARLRQPKWHQP